MKKLLKILLLTSLTIACKNKQNHMSRIDEKKDTVKTNAQKFSAIKLDYKKDPVCGMPVKAGIEDTLLYQGKIIGFCATECKLSFIMNPKSFSLTK